MNFARFGDDIATRYMHYPSGGIHDLKVYGDEI